ncbi:uncharacterized protein LOC121397229 isoform X1 [Xenopus laevis]|uniref:Uncharacterized protein LOC121397229 isoform X1 n=1 Tax=Xenopus laevis TaxID=8355 RepID=A0A8J1LJX0_XENLA|nr:uncharacterized protein LOC121397229 isoform X1 [Xenopus laevis]
MGQFSGLKGVSLRVPQKTYRKPLYFFKKSSKIFRSSAFSAIHRRVAGQGGDCSSPCQAARSGVLLTTFSCNKGFRRITTNLRFKKVEQVFEDAKVQDGIFGNYQVSSSRGRLVSIPGSEGCIFACACGRGASAIPQICLGEQSLSVPLPSLWPVNLTQNILQSPSSSDSETKTGEDRNLSLPGRSIDSSKGERDSLAAGSKGGICSPAFWLGSESEEESARSHTEDNLFGSPSRYQIRDDITSSKEDPTYSHTSQNVGESPIHSSKTVHEFPRPTNLNLRVGEMGEMEYEANSKLVSCDMGPEQGRLVPENSDTQSSKRSPSLVAECSQPSEGVSLGGARLARDLHGCIWSRLGSTCGGMGSARVLEERKVSLTFECPGVEGNQGGSEVLTASPVGGRSEDKIGQRLSCGIYKETGGNWQYQVTERDSTDHGMGTTSPVGHNSSPCTRDPKSTSRYVEQVPVGERGMGVEPTDLRLDNFQMGSSQSRPHGLREESQNQIIFFEIPIEISNSSGCILPDLGGSLGLCVSPFSPNLQGPQENITVEDGGHSHYSQLAAQALVPSTEEAGSPGANAAASSGGSADPGAIPASESSFPQIGGLEVERSVLEKQGCSRSLINTLMKARKSGTAVVYHKIWDRFSSWAGGCQVNPFSPSTVSILEFLQSGLEHGLSLSSLKVQVSALSAVLGKRWAEEPLIEQFFKAVIRIRPPIKKSAPPWDLPLVLQGLSVIPFEPIEEISLWLLSLKTTLLVALTSARRVGELQALSAEEPYTVFHEDKVVLRPVQAFLPKIVTKFHINEPIILPAFPGEEEANPLDVKRCLQMYIEKTRALRKSERLFVIPGGSRKGQAASKPTLSRWIVKAISKAYEVQGRASPGEVRAHSARSMAASWAAEAGVSSEAICKAATWASSNTFIKHYKLDVFSASDKKFGQAVLSAS